MSEAPGEKIFPATPHKRREARKKGQVARSPDLSGALVLLALVLVLRWALTSGTLVNQLIGDFQTAFHFDPRADGGFTISSARQWQLFVMIWTAKLLAPVFLVSILLGLGANISQVGFVISGHSLVPDWTRVSPATGLKRILSTRGVFELIKGIGKIGVIAGLCYSAIRKALPNLLDTSQMPLPVSLSVIGDLIWSLGIRIAITLALLAVVDYAYQKYDFEKNMRMSREEMKQEMKQTDGDPMLRQRIRQKQRAIANKRMMQEVPKADVVITNPTHYAIALKYDAKSMGAPRVVAKGKDYIAQTIKDIARESNVPLVENRPLARALFRDVALGKEIPGVLYQAVAEVLAFVYRTHRKRLSS
ncbi:MAG TPA: flagellar biosynthesis protein FlhB [Capsulimonadaceae bacterium]|nr:flagellar biosynthesis protein FlhB [Capsulimonadaceae bacterium]